MECDRAGVRRLCALVRHLPEDSATHRALNGHGAWSWDRELQARTVEYLDAMLRGLVVANHQRAGKRPKDMGAPMQIEHPDRPRPMAPAASGFKQLAAVLKQGGR